MSDLLDFRDLQLLIQVDAWLDECPNRELWLGVDVIDRLLDLRSLLASEEVTL